MKSAHARRSAAGGYTIGQTKTRSTIAQPRGQYAYSRAFCVRVGHARPTFHLSHDQRSRAQEKPLAVKMAVKIQAFSSVSD
jgi:hypothetical protein